MCKNCEKLVDKLWKAWGEFWRVLVEKITKLNLGWKNSNLLTNFYQTLSQPILLNQLWLDPGFSTFSTPFVISTKLKKGIE